MKRIQQLTGIITCLLFFTSIQDLYAQPPNDECINAIDISDAFLGICGDVTFNGPFTLTGATPGVDDPPEPGEAENDISPGPYCPDEIDTNLFGDDAEVWENSVWFTWTVPDLNGDGSSVTYSVQTSDGSFGDDCGITNPLGGDTDTQAAIYQGVCPTAATGECDHYAASEDLFQQAPWISGWQSIQFIPGVTYYMGVDGWDAVQGEFCITVTVCGQECGNGVCDSAETYCLCEDCQFDEDGLSACTYGELSGVRYDETSGYFLYSPDLSGNIFFCSEFINGFPSSNIYFTFAALPFTNCADSADTEINVSLSVGEILNGLDNGDGTYNISTNLLYFIELSPADIAAGSITITSFASDGIGNICSQTLTVNFTDFPQSTDPYCAISCSAGGVDTDLLDNGITVCEGETFTLSTDGLEDLTLPCNSDDGSSYVYAWRVLVDLYGTGDFQAVNDFQVLGTNPTIDSNTFFIDEYGYMPPYYTPGYPFSLLNPYTGQPWDILIQAAAICINSDGTFVDFCLANNAGYDGSEINVTYLPADDPACLGNPPCTGEFFAYDIDLVTGIPELVLDFVALCPEIVGATGDGLYIPFSFNSDDIPLGADNITYTGSTLSTSNGTLYTFVFGGSPQIPATSEATLQVTLLYLSPGDIAAGIMPTLTVVDATGNCTITITIEYVLPDDPSCSGMEVEGCMDDTACNYDPIATVDDGSCTYPEINFDCDGNCLVNLDCEGDCGGTANEGTTCTDANGNAGIYTADCTCIAGDCEEEITGGITSPDPLCDLSGINIIITAPDGTTTTVTTGADGTFAVPGGPFPCGIYIAAFEDVSMLPSCYTDTGSTAPISFELDGNSNTMDGPFFIANPTIPTLSQWGLMVLALLLMSFGAIQLFISSQNPRYQKSRQ